MDFKVGDSAEMRKTISEEDVRAFAELTGDHNPVHLDEEYAAGTRFGRRIAHGMLGASLVSAVLANELPGRGTVYLSQTLKFTAPVFLGDTVTARVTVRHVREDKPVVTLETVCTNDRGERVVEGEAVVLVPRA
ncbi:MAG: MaoC family dehydratase [Acidobacteria bacterium]|nr:MaoC family dehydratase [Acidobacteriota bacterium]